MSFVPAPRAASLRRSSLARTLARLALAFPILAGAAGCVHRAPRAPEPTPSLLSLEPGSYIRVTAPTVSRTPRVGHLIAVTADTLAMRTDVTLDSVAIPLAAVRQVDLSTFHGSRTSGAVLAGAAVGAGLGVALRCSSSSSGCPTWRRQRSLLAFAGGGVGAGIGALVGRAASRDRWEPVTMPASRP